MLTRIGTMVALVLLAGVASGAVGGIGDVAQAQAQETDGSFTLAGSQWETTYGTMVFSSAGRTVRATYSGQDGTLQGTLDGHTYSGSWSEPDAAVRCDGSRNGSSFWGQFVFTFSEDFSSFDGSWGYCLEVPDMGWTGTRSFPSPGETPPARNDGDPPVPEPEIPDECIFGGQAGRQRIVGVITAVGGAVEIQRGQFEDFEPATSGSINFAAEPDLVDVRFLLREGDVVRTLDDGVASITYFEEPIPLARLADAQGTRLRDLTTAGTAQIDLVPNSAACPGTIDDDEGTHRTIGVLRGAMDWLSANWTGARIFSVRAGTTALGVRGTEFLVVYDPVSDRSAVLVNDGAVEVTNGKQQQSVAAGSWTWTTDGTDTVANPEPLAPGDYDTVHNASTNAARFETLGLAVSDTAANEEVSSTGAEDASAAEGEPEASNLEAVVDSGNADGGAAVPVAAIVAAITVVMVLAGGAFMLRRRRSDV